MARQVRYTGPADYLTDGKGNVRPVPPEGLLISESEALGLSHPMHRMDYEDGEALSDAPKPSPQEANDADQDEAFKPKK